MWFGGSALRVLTQKASDSNLSSVNKMDKALARLTKNYRVTQSIETRNERGDTTTNSTEIRAIIEKGL